MRKNGVWRDNSEGGDLQYDFSPPDNWSDNKTSEECRKILDLLIDPNELTDKAPDWLRLAKKLPQALFQALIIEMKHGNQLIGIGRGNWPTPGSIIVSIRNAFCEESKNDSPETHWRNINDLHYCREEMSQTYQKVEYLILY